MSKFNLKIKKILAYLKAHKIITGLLIIILVLAGYQSYRSITASATTPQYVVSIVRTGSITKTVTGSGQVSAENQLDVTADVSGTIQSIRISVGDRVRRGDLLATIDPKDALVSLENARLSYAKLTQPAKESEISNAKNNLGKSYNDGWNNVTSFFTEAQNIMSGIKDILYGQTGFLSDQRATYLSYTAKNLRQTAGISYDKANNQYNIVLNEYKSLTRESSEESIERLIENTYEMTKTIAEALKNIQSALNFVITNQPEYYASESGTVSSNVGSWSSQINNHVSSLLSSKNSIVSNKNTLTTLIDGPDELDIRSQQISLNQAEENYQKYFVRAPFDGIVGRIPVSVYGQASGSTVVATVIGDKKMANISLNEIDVAKVKVGNKVKITFDAIDDTTFEGTVSQVDLVGAVSQGVVSYGVKIAINDIDERIRPGMSLNVTIITEQKDGVLVVPSSAIKTQGNQKYVQIISVATSSIGLMRNRDQNNTDVSTSSDRNIGQINSALGNRTGSDFNNITISSDEIPKNVLIKIGDADNTNSEITEGINIGEMVIVRTITNNTSSNTQTSAPSILNSLGGTRTPTGTGGTFRTQSR